jgi:hypothetical protein
MGMNVDEPGCEGEAITRDALLSVALGEVADESNPVFGNREIGDERRAAPAVVDTHSFEYCVQQWRLT